MSLKIVHVEAGNNLYGGALQVFYLLQGLQQTDCTNILVCPRESEIECKARGIADRVYAIPMRGDHDIFMLWRLYRILRKEKPDIVHLHSRRGADIWGALAGRFAGRRIILTRRVDNPESSFAVRCKYKFYDVIVTISNGIRDVLIKEGVPGDKLVCVPSAVDVRNYAHVCNNPWFRNEFKLSPDTKVIGMVAQFIERKGHRYLLQAIPDVIRGHPDVRFILFGKGPLQTHVKSLAREYNVATKIIFAEFRNDLERILPCLYILVHPAEMEGLGVSLLQAAACRVPLIGTRVGGIPEIISDGVSGYLISPRSPREISEAIIRLLQAPEKAKTMGDAARKIIEDRFSIDAMVQGNLNTYRQLATRQ